MWDKDYVSIRVIKFKLELLYCINLFGFNTVCRPKNIRHCLRRAVKQSLNLTYLKTKLNICDSLVMVKTQRCNEKNDNERQKIDRIKGGGKG